MARLVGFDTLGVQSGGISQNVGLIDCVVVKYL